MKKFHVMWTTMELIWTVDVSADDRSEALQKATPIAEEAFKDSFGWSSRWRVQGDAYELRSGDPIHEPLLERWADGRTWASGSYTYR